MSLNNVFNFSTVETVGKSVKNVENSELQNYAGIDDEVSCDYFAEIVETDRKQEKLSAKMWSMLKTALWQGGKWGTFAGNIVRGRETWDG